MYLFVVRSLLDVLVSDVLPLALRACQPMYTGIGGGRMPYASVHAVPDLVHALVVDPVIPSIAVATVACIRDTYSSKPNPAANTVPSICQLRAKRALGGIELDCIVIEFARQVD